MEAGRERGVIETSNKQLWEKAIAVAEETSVDVLFSDF